MARIKSLLTHVELDVALKSHNCQGNPKHRVTLGDARLKVRNERGWDHYCLACAKVIVQRDINSLRSVAAQLDGGRVAQSASAPESLTG